MRFKCEGCGCDSVVITDENAAHYIDVGLEVHVMGPFCTNCIDEIADVVKNTIDNIKERVINEN